MRTIEIARKLAGYGQTEEACRAYSIAIQAGMEDSPAEELEAAAYILQFGGDYKISYTSFINLYHRGCFREDILPLITKVFYEPNIKLLKSRYERNRKLLAKYPYLFRKDFPKFEDLPIRFFPYDDRNGYIPFYRGEERFGDFINFKNPVISRNFFHNLDNPVLADDVYSQYELEYLNDNVRRSEDVARENHIYLHYTDWEVFCSYLQCLTLKGLLESRKPVFLIEDEISLYPIDFKERFGIDYSRYTVQPVGIREVSRMIWHAQLSSHTGGDFFNEIFDAHPNLLCQPSLMMNSIEKMVKDTEDSLKSAPSLKDALAAFKNWENPRVVRELYQLRNRTDKDIVVAYFLYKNQSPNFLDPSARIVPALFFQPHFHNVTYDIQTDEVGRAVLSVSNYGEIQQSPIFRNFKYIKTFAPIRRITTSYGATVKFSYFSTLEPGQGEVVEGKKIYSIVKDHAMQSVLSRSFMTNPEDRLYRDSVIVRFEDGKLNPKATFTALAAFLDIPYTETMTYCSLDGEIDPLSMDGNVQGFDCATVYRTYDEYANDAERYFIEYFLRDAYEFYGYGFHYYDGAEVDEEKVKELIAGFTTINHYMRSSWRKLLEEVKVSLPAQETEGTEANATVKIKGSIIPVEQMLENRIQRYNENRLANAKVLLKGLYVVNKNGQPLRMMPKLELDPALLENPLYH